MLHPPSLRRERILVMGGPGVGKTTCWLQVALFSQLTGSPSKFYCIDTDSALEAFIGVGQYADLTNVVVYSAFDWEEYKTALAEIQKRITPEDWSVVDFISPAWDAVQEDYISQVFKTGIDEFYMEARKAKAGGNPLDGWKDWSVINKNYKQWINGLVKRTAGHKFWTATPETIRESDSREVKATFGPFGVRPGGQKHTGFLPHSTLLLQSIKPGDVKITTVKDRERRVLELAPLNNFAIDYLMGVAGWTVE